MAKQAAKGSNTSGRGKSPAELVRTNNRWRENYNPLRGLVISRVVGLLEAGERGEFADLQWLYRFVERRFPVLRALIARRRAAISKLDWEIGVVPLPETEGTGVPATGEDGANGTNGTNSPEAREAERLRELAERQKEWLRSKYEKVTNLKRAIRFLALAEFRGYAHLQKHYGPDGDVVELHWLPQWNWVRDGLFGAWVWNAEAASTGAMGLPAANFVREESQVGDDVEVVPTGVAGATATTLRREDFVIREVEMPIDEVGAIAFVRSGMSQKDWDAFVEMFGLPGCVVTMPADIPQGKETEYEEAATKVAEGSSGAIPAGSTVAFPTGAVRGSAPFKEHLEWQEKDVVLAGTGGKLTMLTGPVGLGGGQAAVHEDVFDEIATAEAGEISEVFQEDFDRVELERAFPGQPVLAFFQLKPVDKTADLTQTFKRDVFKQFMADGTVSDVLANQTDLKTLTEDVGLPVNDEYEDPYLPVTTDGGQVVTGITRGGEGISMPATAPDGAGGEGKLTAENAKNAEAPGGASNAPGGAADDRADKGDGIDSEVQNRVVEEFGAALARDLAPVVERVQRILAIEDGEIMRRKLEELLAEFPQLARDVTADPAAARAIYPELARAMAEGLAGKKETI